MELPFYQRSISSIHKPETITTEIMPARIRVANVYLSADTFQQQLLTEASRGVQTADPNLSAIQAYGNIIPHVNMPWKLYRDVYERVPIIANAVNNAANYAVQAGFEIDGSSDARQKLEKFFDKYNLELILINIFKQMQVYGNAYLEVKSMRLLPPETMYVEVQKGGGKDGDVIGYKQILFSGRAPIPFKKDEIIHFRWNDAMNPFYGMSDIRPVLGVLTKHLNWVDNMGQIVQNYATPFLHHKVGTPEFPASDTQITAYTSSVENRPQGQDLVTSGAIDIQAIGARNKMIQIDGIVKGLENQVIAGMQIPALFIRGGESTNKATADVELQVFERKVRSLQRVVSSLLEDFLFPTITSGKVNMIWNEFSAEGELTRAQRLQLLTQSGIPVHVSLKMVGLGTWVDDVKSAVEEQEKKDVDVLNQQKALLGPAPGTSPQAKQKVADQKTKLASPK